MTDSLETMNLEEMEERLPEFAEELETRRVAEESYLFSLANSYEKPKRKKPYSLTKLEKDRRIVRFVEEKRIIFEPDKDIPLKHNFWRTAYGYERIMTSTGLIPIETCDSETLNSAVHGVYENAKKRLEDYSVGERILNEQIPF